MIEQPSSRPMRDSVSKTCGQGLHLHKGKFEVSKLCKINLLDEFAENREHVRIG